MKKSKLIRCLLCKKAVNENNMIYVNEDDGPITHDDNGAPVVLAAGYYHQSCAETEAFGIRWMESKFTEKRPGAKL